MSLIKDYIVKSKVHPDSKFVNLTVDADGRKYVTVKLPDGNLVEIHWYKVTMITYDGWFMKFIHRRAKKELPDLRDRFLADMKPLSGAIWHQRELQREEKLKRSKKRFKQYLRNQFKVTQTTK